MTPINTSNTPRRDIWYNLDNTANLYPAISGDVNTNVYRLSCNLRKTVVPALLQLAVDRALHDFPHFRVVMRRGLFWNYLEQSELSPIVSPETLRPCAPIYHAGRRELLFRITYYQFRINLEMFHSVADGGGAIQFLQSIVCHYIALAYPQELPDPPSISVQTPPVLRSEDSFLHHYDPNHKKAPKQRRAYTLGGTMLPRGSIRVITGEMPLNQLLALAKAAGTTITAYLSALIICAIHSEMMPVRLRNRTIGILLPVDLRSHFSSDTTRNFFGLVDIRYNFGRTPGEFSQVLADISEQLRHQLQRETLSGRINYTMGVQQNVFVRIAPLVLKNAVLRAAYHKSEQASTCVLSNMGKMAVPPPYSDFISGMNCLLNPTPTHRIKATACSCGDRFFLNFTSCIAETKIQKYVFRHLTANGVEVCITCNGVDEDEIL